jgi:hypothetical protein
LKEREGHHAHKLIGPKYDNEMDQVIRRSMIGNQQMHSYAEQMKKKRNEEKKKDIKKKMSTKPSVILKTRS